MGDHQPCPPFFALLVAVIELNHSRRDFLVCETLSRAVFATFATTERDCFKRSGRWAIAGRTQSGDKIGDR